MPSSQRALDVDADLDGDERSALHRELGRWFAAERRDLPWRRTRDPYAIWVSESMLQQTRVETVIPYFERFLARFPDVASLARSTEDEVLTLWSGLGYYSRARALRAAAQLALERHGGELPRSAAAWRALPGVGPYTAGAVLSIAFSASEALVDGNVQRVLARLFELEDEVGSRALTERCWELARGLVPRAGERLDPGDWNQALMELGARVCSARAPACGACPLRARCAAAQAGRAEELPRPRPRRARVDVRLEILLLAARGKYLCVRRPDSGRMAGLLEFPTRELVARGAAPRLWPAALDLPLERGADAVLAELAHSITCHRVRARVHKACRVPGRMPARAGWFTPRELHGLALTGMARKVLARLPAEARGDAR